MTGTVTNVKCNVNTIKTAKTEIVFANACYHMCLHKEICAVQVSLMYHKTGETAPFIMQRAAVYILHQIQLNY